MTTRDDDFPLGPLHSLDELARTLRDHPGLCIRYSKGPAADADEGSVDRESGAELPGLSVNPLEPERWWSRPVEDWLARQLCQYRQVQENDPDRFAWVLTGREVGRGPDSEPLLADTVAIARVAPRAVDEASNRYRERFDAGRGPEHD